MAGPPRRTLTRRALGDCARAGVTPSNVGSSVDAGLPMARAALAGDLAATGDTYERPPALVGENVRREEEEFDASSGEEDAGRGRGFALASLTTGETPPVDSTGCARSDAASPR